jgi:NADH:ubiquinone oxidoreductase subunit 6 (subunit J)
MVKTKKRKRLVLSFRRRRIRLILDKVLIFRLIHRLHGRFWGIGAISIMTVGFSICFVIRPDMFHVSTAISDFGTDVKTAPYFTGAMFFGAYGLWRWHNYLERTWKRQMPITGLISITVFGLVIAALMPLSWEPWPAKIHLIGMCIAGASMMITVVLDSLLSKTRETVRINPWRNLWLLSFSLIVVGSWLTFGSSHAINWFNVSLLGETMMLAGYSGWIIIKTYQGEGERSALSRLLKKVVLID